MITTFNTSVEMRKKKESKNQSERQKLLQTLLNPDLRGFLSELVFHLKTMFNCIWGKYHAKNFNILNGFY